MQIREKMESVVKNVEKVIIGKRNVIELLLISLLCEGHVLIEDVPGVGKTSLVSALAKSLNLEFGRIQFTPDILPSDITGMNIFNRKTGEFDFHPGAAMANILLADEINRTTPKTQSSLLEIMEEKQATVDGVTYKMKSPFMVLATQNPIDYLGTYPLPEAQLDRFFMKIKIGYPGVDEEIQIIKRYQDGNPLSTLEPVMEKDEVLELQKTWNDVIIKDEVQEYIAKIVRETRANSEIQLGVSPRGGISLAKASKAKALYDGRNYVIPDDVKRMVVPVLAHRMIVKPQSSLKGLTVNAILGNILEAVPVPR
ncbi:MAG TPA: magnesium chelatase [Clostridiales bacterium]|nr:magnesium chelatase [Clostridiales bacterium]